MQDNTGGDGLSAVKESDRDPCRDWMRGNYAVREEKLDDTGSSLPSEPYAARGTKQHAPCGRPPSHEIRGAVTEPCQGPVSGLTRKRIASTLSS